MANRGEAPRAGGEPVVEAEALGKTYRMPFAVRRNMEMRTGRKPPREHTALREVTFRVGAGEVFGVLGPNGAGKTTLMKTLATILLPDAGQLRILGHDALADPTPIRGQIGVVLGEYERTFHWRLTGRQNLLFFGSFFDLPPRLARERADETIALVGLAHKADQMVAEYSTGEKHRLALARGLLNAPRLLILDEPTAGLDAQSTSRLIKTVRGIARTGTAVCYTTHRLMEAGRICDRILILKRGAKVAEASPEALVRMATQRNAMDVTLKAPHPEVEATLGRTAGVQEVQAQNGFLRIFVDDVGTSGEGVLAALRGAGARIDSFRTHTPTVEDVFLELTSEPLTANGGGR